MLAGMGAAGEPLPPLPPPVGVCVVPSPAACWYPAPGKASWDEPVVQHEDDKGLGGTWGASCREWGGCCCRVALSWVSGSRGYLSTQGCAELQAVVSWPWAGECSPLPACPDLRLVN